MPKNALNAREKCIWFQYPTEVLIAFKDLMWPMIIIYLIFQKQYVEGIATSGGKL